MKAHIVATLRNLRARRCGGYRFSKSYDDFESALADSHGYEDCGVVRLVSVGTQSLRRHLAFDELKTTTDRHTLQGAFVVSQLDSEKQLNVLEIGGACGALYFEIMHLLPRSIRKWHVVETPAMAEMGRKMFQDDKLKFFEDLDSAASGFLPDLVIAQSVLQYTPNPIHTWQTLLAVGADHAYIARTAVGVDIERPVVTRQVCMLSMHGPGSAPEGFDDRITSQPVVLVTAESFAESASGYRLEYFFNEGNVEAYAIGSRLVKTRSVGFLFNKVGS